MLSFSEVNQLFKIPVLLEHFAEHRQANPSISFFDFLKMHYTGIFPVDDDYQRDNQLPFRTADCLGFTVQADCPPEVVFAIHLHQPNAEFFLFNDAGLLSLRPAKIFQPPRCA